MNRGYSVKLTCTFVPPEVAVGAALRSEPTSQRINKAEQSETARQISAADREIIGTFWNVIKVLNRGKCLETWWPGTESNRRRQPFQGCALPNSASGAAHFPHIGLRKNLENNDVRIISRPAARYDRI